MEVNEDVVENGVLDAFHAPRSHDIASRSVLNECLSHPQILAQQKTTIKAGNQVVSSTAYGCVGTISFY